MCDNTWGWYRCFLQGVSTEGKQTQGERRESVVSRAVVSGPWNTNHIFREGSHKQTPQVVGEKGLWNKTQQPMAANPLSVTKVLRSFTAKEESVIFWKAHGFPNWFAFSVRTILPQPPFSFLIIPLFIIIFLISICYPLGRGFLNSNIRLFLS